MSSKERATCGTQDERQIKAEKESKAAAVVKVSSNAPQRV
jgi:hypothetical protein